MKMPASSLATVEDARRELSARPILATMRGRTWHGVGVDELSSYTPNNMAFGPRDHHLLSINLGDTPYVRSERYGRVYEGAGLTGEAAIVPAGTDTRWDGTIPPHITIRFSPAALLEMAAEVRRAGYRHAEMGNHFRIRDPSIRDMAAIFRRELARPPHPAQDVLVESLTVALLVHLLRGYSARPGLDEPPLLWAAPAALRRALAYIEDQPQARISLDELAGVAGLSRYHFSRLFRKHVGMSPALYVERSRLEQAKTMIGLGHLPLADIAYALGFADQSHFTRRFRRHVGCTPAAYARDHGRC
jgi:AraC family transcriptional regulator